MKYKILIIFYLSIFTLSRQICNSQVNKPADWPEIIQQPWYQGVVDGKTAFVYLDSRQPENGYFFIADRALPDIYQLKIKRKNDEPRSVTFRMQGKKIRAKYKGIVRDDMIDGSIRISSGNARRFDIPKEIPLFLTLEKPVALPALTPRYIGQIAACSREDPWP